jgi:hypothetical protein
MVVRGGEHGDAGQRGFGQNLAVVDFFLGEQSSAGQAMGELLGNSMTDGHQVERENAPFAHTGQSAMGQTLVFAGFVDGRKGEFVNGSGRDHQGITLFLKNFPEGVSEVFVCSEIQQDVSVQSELFLLFRGRHK